MSDIQWWVADPKGHEWQIDPDTGEPDVHALSYETHNGPRCVICDYTFCEHCVKEIKPCPGHKPNPTADARKVDIIEAWAESQGFDGFIRDHAAVMRNLGKYIEAAHEREVEALKRTIEAMEHNLNTLNAFNRRLAKRGEELRTAMEKASQCLKEGSLAHSPECDCNVCRAECAIDIALAAIETKRALAFSQDVERLLFEVEGLRAALYEAKAWIQNAMGMDKNLCAARTLPLIDIALAASGSGEEEVLELQRGPGGRGIAIGPKPLAPKVEELEGFDMNQCKPGDRLLSCHGEVFTYIGRTKSMPYPHRVRYPDGGEGTRTDNGFVFTKKRLPGDHNIIGFAAPGSGEAPYWGECVHCGKPTKAPDTLCTRCAIDAGMPAAPEVKEEPEGEPEECHCSHCEIERDRQRALAQRKEGE